MIRLASKIQLYGCRFFAAICLIFFSSNLSAAEFSILKGDIFLSGDIVAGDAEKLSRFLVNSGRNLDFVDNLSLDSRGGSVEEAVKIASLIKLFRIDTVVRNTDDAMMWRRSLFNRQLRRSHTAQCLSSCFIVWLAGDQRIGASPATSLDRTIFAELKRGSPDDFIEFEHSGPIGIHRPFVNLDSASNESLSKARQTQLAVMSIMRRYLEEQSVPTEIIRLMLSNSSQSVHWLTLADLEELQYSPDYEEILAQRCNYAHPTRVENSSIEQEKENTKRAMHATSDEFTSCREMVTKSIRKSDRPTFIRELSQGKRPW